MRKIFLVIFILCLLLPLMAFTETENNNTPPVADVIPIGSYVVNIDGITGDNDDWFVYQVNSGNQITVSITAAAFGAALFVDVCTESPAVVQATLNDLVVGSFTFVSTNNAPHYLRVYSTVPGNTYIVTVQNEDDPTLPVVLSSFTGTYDNETVGLSWVTQSETDLSGYNVLRNDDDNFATAIRVNPGLIPAYNTSTTHEYSFSDLEIETNQTYCYWLQSVDLNGASQEYGPVQIVVPDGNHTPGINDLTTFMLPYPNPFNNNTNLAFKLGAEMNVRLDVYNLKGEKIRSLCSGSMTQGDHNITWNGKNDQGLPVSSGVYLSRLVTPQSTYIQKVYLQRK